MTPPETPTVTLAANPTTIASGGSSMLTWTSAHATTCTASGGWSGTKALNGTQSTGALAATTTFTLTCSGNGGNRGQDVTVAVAPPPTVTLAANPTSIASGGSSTLTWNSTGATSCTASGGWTGTKTTTGSQSTGALTATTTFTLTCSGLGGSANQSATVTVHPAPTVTLAANPTSVATGGSSMLTWTSANATGCAATGAWSGARATSGSESTGPLTVSSTFTLTCNGPGGSASQSASVAVGPNPAPTVALTANPTSIATGASSTLNWSSTDATGCTASDGWSGAKATSGSQSTGPLNVTTNFTLTCTGPGGSASQTATVTVTPPPTVTLTANPTAIASGASSTLTWNSTNATGCTASGGWSGARPTSGSQSTGALTATTSFTINCTGPGGSANQTATVTVLPAPTVTLTANPTSVASGASSTLTWGSTNATGCTASGGWSGAKATSGNQSTGALTATTTFTLTCTGPGGSGQASATVTVQTASATFPLHVEAGKRYLIDAQGRPFFIVGDAPWSLMVGVTRAQADQYLEDRRAKGFNTVLVNLIEHMYAPNAPANLLGDRPFLIPGDYATPNEAYFANAEYVIGKAAEKGMLVLLTPSYMGYAGNTSGWYAEMVLNGATKLRTYGQYVATRFRAFDNILWVHGGDFDPPEKDLLRAIVNGIRDVETKWLHTFHGGRGTSALGFLGTGETWLTVNDTYAHVDDAVSEAFIEYNRSTMPFFQIEAIYENESGAGAHAVRHQAYQAVLSGAAGQVMGNNPIWLFDSGWQTALNSAGSRSMTHLGALFAARQWHLLVPDQTGAVLTAGTGTGAGRAATARAGDGSFVLSYTPSVRALTINMTQLAGPNVIARWFDPSNGAFTTIAGSPFAASGSRTFTPSSSNAAGDGDWVLVLESVP